MSISEWVVDDKPQTPLTNLTISIGAQKTQKNFSKHKPIYRDSDWDDILIDLPENSDIKKWLRISGQTDDSITWLDDAEKLISWGMVNGYIPEIWIDRIFKDTSDSEFVKKGFIWKLLLSILII